MWFENWNIDIGNTLKCNRKRYIKPHRNVADVDAWILYEYFTPNDTNSIIFFFFFGKERGELTELHFYTDCSIRVHKNIDLEKYHTDFICVF